MSYSRWKEEYVDNSFESIVKRAAKEYNIEGIVDLNHKAVHLSKYSFDDRHTNFERLNSVSGMEEDL